MSEETRGKHFRIVKNQQIVGPQQLRKVAKHEVVEAVVTAPEMKQPRGSPVGERFLRNQLFGQAIVEIGNQHKAIMPDREAVTLGCLRLPFCGNRLLR